MLMEKENNIVNISLIIVACHSILRGKTTVLVLIAVGTYNSMHWMISYMYYSMYRTRAIITRGLYFFYPIFEDHFFVFKELFS